MSVNIWEEIWRCHDCQIGGSVIDWIAIESGKSAGDVLKDWARDNRTPDPKPVKTSTAAEKKSEIKYEIETTYSYTDAFGSELYQVVRMRPKTFRQRHTDGKGGWIWNMDGVERVLYRLGHVLSEDVVAVAEGEKDANTLMALGYCGTCNVGGAGKWLDGYTETLAGKDVLIFGDNDKPGQEHVEAVFHSIAGKAKSVKMIGIPQPSKDISEFVLTFPDIATARREIQDMVDSAHPFLKGIRMPLQTMSDSERRYETHAQNMQTESFSLGSWLPSLNNRLRHLVPGELVLLLGATGVGKTALLQNIAMAARPIPTLLFELELPETLLFERFVAAERGVSCRSVEQSYASGESLGPQALQQAFPHLYLCTESRMSLEQLESLIARSDLKIGRRPVLVLLDYVQLMQGSGKSRYERFSNIAEELKVIAKRTRTIIVASSQVGRPDDDDPEITLYDGKESGSLENSAGLVIGAWRDEHDSALLHLKILKNTKGSLGGEILCNFHVDTMRITERSPVADVPSHNDP